MQNRAALPRPWRPAWLRLAMPFLCALPFLASEDRAVASSASRITIVAASSCSDACDKKASDCVDVCEEKFKDDKPRLQCKLSCIGDREKCEKDCK